jgi:hypothetical protein
MRKYGMLFFPFMVSVIFLAGCTRVKEPYRSEGTVVPGRYLVWIRNYGESMWIGTDSDSIAAIMRELVQVKGHAWIGGKVVPDASLPHGFYFDPATVLIAEFTAEGMQTTIAQIAADPQYYATHGWSTSRAEHAWYVWGEFVEYRRR